MGYELQGGEFCGGGRRVEVTGERVERAAIVIKEDGGRLNRGGGGVARAD